MRIGSGFREGNRKRDTAAAGRYPFVRLGRLHCIEDGGSQL